jgi:hypothetical protein
VSIPVPLGVRIYDHLGSVDVWVTRWVDDLTFRSVVPGGFASASFRLHLPQHLYPVAAGWANRSDRLPLVRLVNRVQIVDLRTSEIAWEGRIDSAARVTDDGYAWDIGCAGAMVAATDITKPVFYIDSSLDGWTALDASPNSTDQYNWASSESSRALQVTFRSGEDWFNTFGINAYFHFICFATSQYLGRFSVTYRSIAPSVTGGTSMTTRANVYTAATDTWQDGVDSTALGATEIRKTNAVGGASSFTSTTAQVIGLDVLGPSPTGLTIPSSSTGSVTWVNPVVVAQRVDRSGTRLTSASTYNNDYVTVSQVVEDVLGRFLNNAWTTSSGAPLNNPAPGSVGTANAYIDTSDTTQITDLKFVDGATAADILNQLMTVQTDAYWAIWESTNTATNDFNAQRFRFEWATWPNSWGYLASSADGLDEQPDAENVYNFVSYQYSDTWHAQNIYVTPTFQQEWWDFTDPGPAPLLKNRVTRAAVVKKDGTLDSSAAATNASAWVDANGKEINTGSITIRRPILLYDAGADSGSGAGRMLDPWMIRPGKLIHITDVPPTLAIANFAHGTTLAPSAHAGTLFKVIATNYDSSDNSCRLELDQVTAWSLPGQIVRPKAGNVQTIPG